MSDRLAIEHRRWTGREPPARVLAMRFQALGDTVITLPYLQSLRRRHPQVRLDLLTRAEVAAIPRDLDLFDDVMEIGGGRTGWKQWLSLLRRLPELRSRRYDVVLDLQNHRLSRFVRRCLAPAAWSGFERLAPRSAGDRTRATIEAACDWQIECDTRLTARSTADSRALLEARGWRPEMELVVLNPAGNLPSRSWPAEDYVEFARLWQSRRNPLARFVLALAPHQVAKSRAIARGIGPACIDLTGASDALQAFGVVGASQFVLSEDSGLMHMAWVQGVPTLALFSSSRSDWSRPLGNRSACLDSADLDCGPCGLAVCRYGDNRCLTRHTPARVFAAAEHLLRP